MFDGKSRTRYVGLGQQKSKSASKVIHDSRIQREKRALEKKRNVAAIQVQATWRRYLMMNKSKRKFEEELEAEVSKILKISSIMKFSIPLESLYGLIRRCVFVFSGRKKYNDKTLQAVLTFCMKSINSVDPKFCIFSVQSLTKEEIQRWQVLVSSLIATSVKYIARMSSFDTNTNLPSLVIELVKSFVAFAKNSILNKEGEELCFGTSIFISLSLGNFFQQYLDNKSRTKENALLNELLNHAFDIIGIAVNSSLYISSNSNSNSSLCAMGTCTASQKALWETLALYILSFPRLWEYQSFSSVVERSLFTSLEGTSRNQALLTNVWSGVLNVVIEDENLRPSSVPFVSHPFCLFKFRRFSIAEKSMVLSLMNNFLDHSSRHIFLLHASSGLTALWTKGLNQAFDQYESSLVQAINSYHSNGDAGLDAEIDDEVEDASLRSCCEGAGFHNAIHRYIEHPVAEVRRQIMHSKDQSTAGSEKLLKKPRLLWTCEDSNQSKNKVAELVVLLNHLSTPLVFNALVELWRGYSENDEHENDNKWNTNMNELCHVLSTVLMFSPASSHSVGPSSQASLSSRMLGIFSFNRFSQSLVEGLWNNVSTHLEENVEKAATQNGVLTSSNLSTTSTGRVTSTPVIKTSSIVNIHRKDYSSDMLALFNILSHQLLTIDDDEFKMGSKTLPIPQICELVSLLKRIMFEMYWTLPLLSSNEAGVFTDSKSPALSLHSQLLRLQLMYIVTKLFNQLSCRNERLHFLEPSKWLWHLGNAELDLLDIDADPFQDEERSRAKMVLLLCPQVIDFKHRAKYFQKLIRNDKLKTRGEMSMGMLRKNIHRSSLFESAFGEFSNLTSSEWRKDIRIVFINEQGMEESGIDGGGLFKEFIDILLKDMFSPSQNAPSSTAGDYRRLFLTTSKGLLAPNPSVVLSADDDDVRLSLEQYSFMGKMLGKAVYEEILVEPQFAGMFLNMLLGRSNLIDDLASLDDDIYRSLLKMKRDYLYGDGNVEELELTFEVRVNKACNVFSLLLRVILLGGIQVDAVTSSGKAIERDLLPGGRDITVNKQNLVSYLYLYANYKLNIESRRQSMAFLQGFREIIPMEWIQMFSPSELQLVIGGNSERGIDLPALKRICTYSGGYHPSQPYIQEFWKILESLSPSEQGAFLRFVTSCSRPPLLGYEQFHPPFNIMKISPEGGGPAGSKRLPMAASCFNQLKLPQYESTEELRVKLLYSIHSKSGFELS